MVQCLMYTCLNIHLVLCAVQPALEQLAFENVGCSINACTSLAELLENTQELRNLRLYNNMSDDAGAAAIAKVDYVTSQNLSQYPQHTHCCIVQHRRHQTSQNMANVATCASDTAELVGSAGC